MDCGGFGVSILLATGEVGYNMTMKETIKKPEIQFWTPIITAIVGIAVAWGIMSTRVNSLEKRFDFFGGRVAEYQEKTEFRFESIDNEYTQIQVTLAEIQKDIAFIKEKLE